MLTKQEKELERMAEVLEKDKSKIKTITMAVLSYCKDIPEGFDYQFEEYTCGIYVPWSYNTDPEYDQDPLDLYLAEKFPELNGVEFLINMDY